MFMKLGMKAVAGVSTLAIAGTMALVGGGVANASTPFDPALSGATQGTLSLFNASGQQIISGPLSTPPAYVRADTDSGKAGDTTATVYAATPQKGVNAGLWSNAKISIGQAYPTSSASVPANLQGSALALGSGIYKWLDPAVSGSYAEAFPNVSGAGAINTDATWQNVYQLRVITSPNPDPSRYASASIQVDSVAGTWTQVYPDVSKATTTTTLTDPGQQLKGAAFTLSGTVAPAAAAGSVELFDGATLLGSTSVSGGNFSKSVTLSTLGSHTLKAVFTADPPAGGLVGYANSNSGNVAVNVVKPSAQATTTTLGVNPVSGEEKSPVTLTASVSPVAALGSFEFYDNGALIPGSSTPVGAGGGGAFTSSNFAFGAHSFTATFVPTDATDFQGSTSAAVTADYTKRTCSDGTSNCVDDQTVVVRVPGGGLAISTPYGPLNPFSLGTMTLDASGTSFNAAAEFPNAGDHLAITDTRAGNLPWTAYITSTDFSDGGSGVIDATDLAYLSVSPHYISGNRLDGSTPNKTVVTNDVPSVKGAPHQFASAVRGSGSVYIDGALALTAPSSTPAGLYTATVTFTIS